MRIHIKKDRPSQGAVALRDALKAAGHRVHFNSPKEGDKVIVWGSVTPKDEQLLTLTGAGVTTIPWTTLIGCAQRWADDGFHVYERHKLRGHSGDGIVVKESNTTISPAPLYTRGIMGGHREYRVHCIGGETFVQQKKRRNGFSGLPQSSSDIRNHANGWIYSHLEITPINPEAVAAACDSVQALGYAYGAVDIITKGDEVWVLEVNSAPGLEGTTLQFYVNNWEGLCEYS